MVEVDERAVLSALEQSPGFSVGTEGHKLFSAYAGRLVQTVTDTPGLTLSSTVTLKGLYLLSSNYLEWLAGNQDFLRQFENPSQKAESCRKRSAAHLKLAKIAGNLALSTLDEAEALTRSESGFQLNQKGLRMFAGGRLTFAKLLVTSPESFLPY